MGSPRGQVGLLILLTGLFLVSCGPSGPPATKLTADSKVSVVNVDGPTVGVRIGGRDVTRLVCGEQTVLDPGGDAGALPWRIEFLLGDGSVFGTVDESVSSLLPYIVIRFDGVVTGTTPGIGPVPAACP
jgi:hypothetical protein